MKGHVVGVGWLGLGSLLASLVALAGIAWANTFGTDGANAVWFNETNFQRYWYEDASMNGEWKDAANWVRSTSINPTHMYSVIRQAHDSSDVAVYRRNMAGNIVGVADCIDEGGSEDGVPQDGERCRHWHVTISTDFDPYPQAEKRHVLCHEFGHTVGLQHYTGTGSTDSCMKEPANTRWGSHDRFHVNNHYNNNPNG